MAIKNTIAQGIGFTSDGTIWIPTHGYGDMPVGATLTYVRRLNASGTIATRLIKGPARANLEVKDYNPPPL